MRSHCEYAGAPIDARRREGSPMLISLSLMRKACFRVRHRAVPEARVGPGGGATTAWRLNEKTRSQPLETAKEKSKTDRRSEVAALAFVAGAIRANSRRKTA